MKVAIVGSRTRRVQEEVNKLVDSLKKTDVIVSGGCAGPDTWAEQRAILRGMKTIVHRPRRVRGPYHEVVNSYYERNRLIARDADIIYAFVSKSREGGTENTIKWAEKFNKKVVIK